MSDALPEIISPALLLEKLVPGWAEDVFSPPTIIEDVAFNVQVEVEDAEGSPWAVRLDLGDYSVERGEAEEPFLTLRGSESHWNLTWGRWLHDVIADMEEAGGPENLIESLEATAKKRGQLMKLTDEKLEALVQLPTLFGLEVDNLNGETIKLRVGLAHSDLSKDPSFTLRVDGETFEKLRKNKADPVQAWKDKRISLEGDLVHATKLFRILQRKD